MRQVLTTHPGIRYDHNLYSIILQNYKTANAYENSNNENYNYSNTDVGLAKKLKAKYSSYCLSPL